MNICLVSTGYPPEDGGGIGTYIYNLAKGLSELGHRIFIIAKTYGEDAIEENHTISIYRYKARYIPKLEHFIPGLAWSMFVAEKIKELDKAVGLDLIEFPNWEGVGFVYLLSRKRKPVITRLHTPYFETLMLDKQADRVAFGDHFVCWMERKACQWSDGLVSSTKFHREMMAENYKLKKKPVHILPLGIQLISGNGRYQTKEDRPMRILYVSRLENRKGAMTLLRAIPRVLEQYPQTEFFLIGKDRPHTPDGLTHKDYFFKHYPGLCDHVHFLGFVSKEKLSEYYKQTDIFVVPSVYESFGLIYVEAMMHGVPVIGCRAGGIPEVVENEKTGILVDPDDDKALTDAICRLMSDPVLREKMGSEARIWCDKHFSHLMMAHRTDLFYRRIHREALGYV